MYSIREGFLAPPTVLPPRDPNLGLSVPDQCKKPAKEPVLQKLDLDKINQQWSNKREKSISQSNMNKFSSMRFHPDGASTSGSNGKSGFSTETMARPPIILPPKDPTIGLDLVKKCAKPKEESKMLFLPEKIDIDKINEYYRKEDLKIINKNKPKEKAQNKPMRESCLPPSPQYKGCRKALFELSKNSIRKSFKYRRTSILIRNSIVTKNTKIVNESLLDASLVEKKIFNTKSHGAFKFKSPKAAQKELSKPQIKLSEQSQKKKDTSKNVNKKLAPKLTKKASASAKKISEEKPCAESITSNLKEIRNLIALNREDFGNLTKHYDAFKEAHKDCLVKIEDLLQKTEFISSKCKNDENSVPPTAKDSENLTLKKSAGRASALKKTVQLDSNTKALNLYNSLRQDYSMMLSTPKITQTRVTVESPTPKNLRKIISRKIEQQCLLLQETPMKK